MKFSRAEQAALCITAAVLLFSAGWFCRDRQEYRGYTITAQGALPSPSSSPSAQSRPLDLNTATAEELSALPGLGPIRAQAIVDYRSANGPFAWPEDVLAVEGIGPVTFEGLAGYITTSADSSSEKEGEAP